MQKYTSAKYRIGSWTILEGNGVHRTPLFFFKQAIEIQEKETEWNYQSQEKSQSQNQAHIFFFILLLNSDFLHFWCTNNQQYVPKY